MDKIKRLNELPSYQEDYQYINWMEVAKKYINYILDTDNKYDGLDRFGNKVVFDIAKEETSENIDYFFNQKDSKFMSILAYLGLDHHKLGTEGINYIALVLTGTLCGYDMRKFSPNRKAPFDYLKGVCHFYRKQSGENLVSNSPNRPLGQTFWYDLFPNVLTSILYKYYKEDYLKEMVLETSKRLIEVVDSLGGKNCSFDGTKGYDYINKKVTYVKDWPEPDGATGIAYLLYSTYYYFKDDKEYSVFAKKCLEYSSYCMDYLNGISYSPLFEVLHYFAPCIAAKLNKELGKNYDVSKFIAENTDGSYCRPGWGMINESWGGKNTYGLFGSITDGDGYAFTMNTFDAAIGFIPLVKYDTRYKDVMGKWILNVSNSTRYFYSCFNKYDGDVITDTIDGKDYSHFNGFYQSSEYLKDKEAASFIAYEGLRKYKKGFHWTAIEAKENFEDRRYSPYASGDSFTYNWHGNTDFGLYGSSHVGLFGALIENTNVEQILKIDLNSLDFLSDDNNHMYMFYNPYEESKEVIYKKNSKNNKVYDYITGKEIVSLNNEVKLTVPKQTSIIIVEK